MEELKGVILSEEQQYYILDLLENRRDEVLTDDEYSTEFDNEYSDEFKMASSCIKAILSSLYSKENIFPEV